MSDRATFEETMLLEALALPADTRRAFIESRCGGDDASARRMIALLQGYQENSEFLETPAAAATLQSAGRTFSAMPPEPEPGDRISRYHLLERIGEGGFGVVYLAEQEQPVRRQVALKVIRLGLDTREFIARFEAERQALALMDHPNIARVFDAGATDSGRPYLVMELIRGVPITAYGDKHLLPVAARIELYLQVCGAIQHAHQKGIIHRDLKPSNLLVELHDPPEAGRPKVIDFGIAKATHDRLTDKTLFTRFQALIGTPAYTSPEQMDLSGRDVDTRSDVYSLGVLLYELLSGQQPFDRAVLERASLEEMRHLIREVDPPRPSVRVGALTRAERARVAHHRGIEPEKLAPLLHTDLDWIVMRCLEKDRNRRYETANALAMDLRRHLANEPVVARPPSRAYQFAKFARRNRTWVTAGTTIALALIAGLALAFAGFARARVQQRAAETARREAEDLVSFMVRDLKPELQRTGRSPLTAQVTEKAVQYYSKLPPNLNDASTERNRAIALEALAYVRSYAGHTDAATSLWHESLLARQRAAAGAPHHPLFAGELALSEFVEVAHSWPLVLSESPGPGSPEIDARLAGVVTRAREACGAHLDDAAVARIFARVLAGRSRYLFQTSTRLDEGLALGREAEKLYRELLAHNPGETALGTEFVQLLDNISATAAERPESVGDSIPVAEEALAFAEAEWKKNPENIELRESAAFAVMELCYRLSGGPPARANAAAAVARERWGALVQLDPQNFFYQHRYAWANQMEGYFLYTTGRKVEGGRAAERFISLLSPIARSPSDFLEIRGQTLKLAALAAQFGDDATARLRVSRSKEWHEKYLASLAPEVARQPEVQITYLAEQCLVLDCLPDAVESERKARALIAAISEARQRDPGAATFLAESTQASYYLSRALLHQQAGAKAVPILQITVRTLEGPDGRVLLGLDADGAILEFKDLLGEALIASGDTQQARIVLEKDFAKWEQLDATKAASCAGVCVAKARNALLLATLLDPSESREAKRRATLLTHARAELAGSKSGDPATREELELSGKIEALRGANRPIPFEAVSASTSLP